MNQSVSELERSIFELPLEDQEELLARVTKILRKRNAESIDRRLEEMAGDEDIQRELKAIEKDFAVTEFDGLAE